MIKNILLIAYYFPPLGGAGVQRTLKFAKYLNKNGYNVTVLTVSNEISTVKDKTLLDEIDGISIYRAKVSEHKFMNKIINRSGKNVSSVQYNNSKASQATWKSNVKKLIKNIFLKIYLCYFIPDDKISWKKDAVRVGLDVIKEKNIDLIYSTSAPYTSHLIALELVKKKNIPWICDFRDAWSMNPFVKYPYFIKLINSHLEKQVIKNTDVILSVSQPIINDLKNKYEYEKKYQVITNGYDEDDFIDFDSSAKSSKFMITYNGTLYGKRSPKNLFMAINNLILEKKIDEKSIQINFIGQIGREIKNEIMDFSKDYPEIIKCIDYIPHKESINYLENSSALLLIIEGGEGSDGIYTGKIFEYIRSGKNIIGIVPDGVARNLINSTNTGFCSYPDDVNEIEDSVLNCYRIWKGDMPPLKINWEEIKQYDRESLSNDFIKIIEEMKDNNKSR